MVLATGTSPLIPPIPGLREAGPWDNRSYQCEGTPAAAAGARRWGHRREMAQAYKRLGCDEVVVLEGAERLLAREEPFAGEGLRAAFEAEGITVVTGARITAARRLGSGGPVVATLADGREFTGDEILVAVGRRLATAASAWSMPGSSPGALCRWTGSCGRQALRGDGCMRSATAMGWHPSLTWGNTTGASPPRRSSAGRWPTLPPMASCPG